MLLQYMADECMVFSTCKIGFKLFTMRKFPVYRLEEKLSNLESENQILRQQALVVSPAANAVSLRSKTTIIQVPYESEWKYLPNVMLE